MEACVYSRAWIVSQSNDHHTELDSFYSFAMVFSEARLKYLFELVEKTQRFSVLTRFLV
jgi:hypothetical protein